MVSADGWFDEDRSTTVWAATGPRIWSGTFGRAAACDAAGAKTDPGGTPLRCSVLR